VPEPTELAFSRSLYTPEAVRDAVAAYQELARFEVLEGGDDVQVRVSDPDPEVNDLLDEFCNHVLFETVKQFRAVKEPA
jgi:hypothetical protein